MGKLELLAEKSCEMNDKKSDRPKCSKPTPGAAVGGCAFDGAQITLIQIADAAHIVHSGSTCIGCSWNNRGTRSTAGALYRYGISTDLNEIDIIMGSSKKLYDKIVEIFNIFKPKAVFVYSTCVTDMVGEDIQKVCADAQDVIGIPVIAVEAPGFIGNKNYGNRVAGEVIFNKMVGTKEPATTTGLDISIIADYNIAGELWRVLPYFEEIGINVLCKITGDATFDEICYAHRAKASMVVCSRALVGLAKKIHDKYGVPFFEGSFYGLRETGKALRNFAELLGNNKIADKAEKFIHKKEAEVKNILDQYKKFFEGKKVFIYSGGVKSWSMVMQLEELGFDVIGSGIRKSSDSDIEKLRKHFEGTQKILLEKGEGSLLIDILKNGKADLFIAGSRNMYLSMKSQYPYVDVNQERIRAYAGYEGMIDLAQDIYHTMYSPVFKAVKNKPLFMEHL